MLAFSQLAWNLFAGDWSLSIRQWYFSSRQLWSADVIPSPSCMSCRLQSLKGCCLALAGLLGVLLILLATRRGWWCRFGCLRVMGKRKGRMHIHFDSCCLSFSIFSSAMSRSLNDGVDKEAMSFGRCSPMNQNVCFEFRGKVRLVGWIGVSGFRPTILFKKYTYRNVKGFFVLHLSDVTK